MDAYVDHVWASEIINFNVVRLDFDSRNGPVFCFNTGVNKSPMAMLQVSFSVKMTMGTI